MRMPIFQSDSITADTVVRENPPEAYQSLIDAGMNTHEIQIDSRPVHDHPFWVSGILIFSFILLAWGRLFFRRRLEMIFRAAFAKNYANQLIREGNLFNERIGLVLFVVYLAVISLFVYLSIPIVSEVEFLLPEGMLYLSILGFFLGFWLMKVILSKILSLLFNTGENSRELLANMYLFNLFAGIVLLPLVACMAFAQANIFFYISLLVIAFIYTYRLLREATIGFTVINFSVFHLFLYLCTLEILPLIVLAKILIRNMIL
ncbi:MAG: hypothetical protein DRJ15_04875 [Bacteroidetes bacterium]|nr:MAG: hypothetical protein DRJ15_04875 [Bacteroidota bacterium]